jgi:hypothetical protein
MEATTITTIITRGTITTVIIDTGSTRKVELLGRMER